MCFAMHPSSGDNHRSAAYQVQTPLILPLLQGRSKLILPPHKIQPPLILPPLQGEGQGGDGSLSPMRPLGTRQKPGQSFNRTFNGSGLKALQRLHPGSCRWGFSLNKTTTYIFAPKGAPATPYPAGHHTAAPPPLHPDGHGRYHTPAPWQDQRPAGTRRIPRRSACHRNTLQAGS